MLSDRTSQVSMEYLILLGFVIFVVSIILIISADYSADVKQSVALNQIDRIAKDIINSAESVYYFGEPSKTTVKIFIPERVKSVSLEENHLIFKVQTASGLTDVGYKTVMPMQGSIPTTFGEHYITIEARGGYVWLNGT